jgi:hypothetical protein
MAACMPFGVRAKQVKQQSVTARVAGGLCPVMGRVRPDAKMDADFQSSRCSARLDFEAAGPCAQDRIFGFQSSPTLTIRCHRHEYFLGISMMLAVQCSPTHAALSLSFCDPYVTYSGLPVPRRIRDRRCLEILILEVSLVLGDAERAAVRALRRFERRCYVVAVTDEVLARGKRPFPVEPFARSMRCTSRQQNRSASLRS